MKLLTKIQMILTVLAFIAFVVELKIALWLHSMSFSYPVRQLWQPRLDMFGDVLWFGLIGFWFLFTVFHLIIVIGRKLRAWSGV